MSLRFSVSRMLQTLVVVMFSLTLAISLLVPVYTDEITWKILQVRFFLDGLVNITLFPQCGEPFTTPTLWFMVPVRVIDAWAYADISTPFQLRIFGVLTAGVWICILLLMLPKSLAIRCGRLYLAAVVLAYLGLGILPFIIIINRPEQVILLFLTVIFLTPFVISNTDAERFGWILAPGFLCSAIILFSYHPKTLVFLPLIVISAYFLFRKWTVIIPLYMAIAYVAAQSYSYWTERMRCPDDVQFQNAVQATLMPLSRILSDPFHALRQGIGNIWLHRIAFHISIRKTYKDDWDWLPTWQPSDNGIDLPAYHVVNTLIYVFTGILIIIALIVGFYVFVKLASEIYRNGAGSKRMAIAASCFFSIFVLFLTQGEVNFYEATLDMPILGVAILVGLTPELYRRFASIWRGVAVFLMCLALLSEAVLWRSILPEVRILADNVGYIPDQPRSVAAFDFDKIRKTVVETAQLCRIDPSERPRHLVVDDLTYLALAQAYQPYNLYYLMNLGREEYSGSQILRLLTERHSAGLVAGCHLLPHDLRSRAVENGPFCCIPAFGP